MGALAIISLVAALFASALVGSIYRQQVSSEDSSLAALGDGLGHAIRRTRSVPSSSTWVSFVAGDLNRSHAAVSNSITGSRRLLLSDPGLSLGPPGGPFTLPYTQTGSGAAQPANLRLMLISSLGPPLPSAESIPFTNLWNCPPDVLPTNWPVSWTGQAREVRVRRLDLSSLFRRLVLNNLTSSNAAVWSLGIATNQLTIAAGARTESWIVDATPVTFYNQGPALAFREVIRTDASYVYEFAGWRHLLFTGPPTTNSCGAFADLIEQFLAAPLNPSAPKANTQTCVDAMFHFMEAYSFWSAESACANNNQWFTAQNQVSVFSANFDSASKFLY